MELAGLELPDEVTMRAIGGEHAAGQMIEQRLVELFTDDRAILAVERVTAVVRVDELVIRQAALEANAYRVLPKPIGVRDLTTVVRQALAEVYHWPVG